MYLMAAAWLGIGWRETVVSVDGARRLAALGAAGGAR